MAATVALTGRAAARDEHHTPLGSLAVRTVDFWSGLVAEADVTDVPGDTHDSEPCGFPVADLQAPAERKWVSRPIASGKHLIDDRDSFRFAVVPNAEFAAGDERNPHGLEIAGADDHVPRHGILPRIGLAFDANRDVVVVAGQGKSLHDRRPFNTVIAPQILENA